ncbi:hypothetical protein B9T62_29975 [Paenibacillus donghaensis]|uniref:DUF4367 domain-containing protein n=2 Tax=Paenibacillus donghaensis TaxID=414771 RepID=A0A2Z2KSM8_9BACL|nr:hypothetical protein B9T62_29975 [Paenibacillus donghaensis]
MKYTTRQILMVSCLTVMVVGGCSNVSKDANSVSPTSSTVPTITEVATGPVGGVTEDELTKLTYTDQQKKDILIAAQKAGLKTVYIPTIGAGPDDSLNLVEVDGNTLILKFVRQAIAESAEEIKPSEEVGDGKTAQLNDTVNGKWIPAEKGSSVNFLYFKLDKTYVKYYSSKPFFEQDFEASARSMIPLE